MRGIFFFFPCVPAGIVETHLVPTVAILCLLSRISWWSLVGGPYINHFVQRTSIIHSPTLSLDYMVYAEGVKIQAHWQINMNTEIFT